MKFIKISSKKHQKYVIEVLLVSLFLTLTDFTNCSGISIIDFQQVNVDWLRYYATFKVRKFKSLLYKLNTFFQKITTCIGLQTEQILFVNI